MRGSARMARAIATRCRCPPDSFTPRSPTIVSYLASNLSMNSSQCAMRLTVRTSSSVASGLRERDVLLDRAVEQEIVLHHDAEIRAIVAESKRRDVSAIHEHAARSSGD